MATLACEIVAPNRKLFSEQECHMIVVPGTEGEMGIMANHAPIISTLRNGTVRVYSDPSTVSLRIAVYGGYMSMVDNLCTILAERAVIFDELDAAKARDLLAKTRTEYDSLPEDDPKRSVLEHDMQWFEMLERLATEK